MSSYNLSMPAMAAPEGVSPNFEHPEDQNELAWITLTLMMVVSTLCVILRVYGRVYLPRKIVIEDAFNFYRLLKAPNSYADQRILHPMAVLILCAYGNYWGCTYASYSLIYTPGFFVHSWELLLSDTIKPYYYIFVFGVFYSVVLAPLKVAILVDWCRLFVPGTRTFFFWGSVAVIVLQTAFGIAAIFLLTFQCVPHEAIWNFTIKARCLPLNPLQITAGLVHLISDVAIFLLPQKIIWTLNMSLRKRFGIAVVFGLGALAVVCSVMRLVETVEFGRSEDKMYTISPVILWATGEMTCGFFVVCVPCLPKVLSESSVGRAVRQILGFGTCKRTGENSIRSQGNERQLRKGAHKLSRGKAADAYRELDEEFVPLDNFESRHAKQNSQA